ncbi:aspartate carbamoyltransferase [bacterium]|nr:aspartate carbamoyltransferase [bacterium]
MIPHLLSVDDLKEDFLIDLWDEALKNKGKNNKNLKNKIITNLFYEPSTRTSSSFYSAMIRSGGTVIPINNVKFSSVTKGESLEDTIRTMACMCDGIVLRHDQIGAAKKASAVSSVPIINAGDGNGEHPTQTILDGFTIYNHFNKSINNLKITMVGDLKNGRTVKSLVKLLNRFSGNSFCFVSPEELKFNEKLPINSYETADINEVLNGTNVLYVTRVQKERGSIYDYELSMEQLNSLPKDAIVMHPFPRVTEIPVSFDSDPRAKYFDQIKFGIWCRQILLEKVLLK